jgi:hypothetical protein
MALTRLRTGGITGNAVVAASIAPGAVDIIDIADGAVTELKLAANAITSAKIEANAITSLQVAANAITSTEIASGAVEQYLNDNSVQLFFRNRIINGDMRIDQRNAGASVTQTTVDPYTLDRWMCGGSVTSKFTVQQNAGSVTPPVGFTNYLGVTSSSAYSVGSGDFFYVMQGIEGYNVADLNFGTANSKTVTVSFWVRSSLTGNFGGVLRNKISGADRSYPFTYTISAANTWEQKSVTITGDTTGTWASTNACSLTICFGLGTGSTFSGTSGAWASSNLIQPTSTVSVVGTNGATFYITGVQLEVGSVATPFERRPYGTEFQLCQRYYETWGGESVYQPFGISDASSTTGSYSVLQYLVPKRIAPSVSMSSASHFHTVRDSLTLTSLTFAQMATTHVFATLNVASGMTTGQAYTWRANNTLSARINFSAEL